MKPFTLGGATTTVAASTTSADEAIATKGRTQILVTNAATVLAYIKSGIGAQTATSADTPVLGNSAQTFTIPSNHDTVAVLLASGTGNVYFTVGIGE
jgi:hypothetical protein